MKRGFWIMKLKVLSTFDLTYNTKKTHKHIVLVALQGTNELQGNKHLLTKDGIKHEILGQEWICSRESWDNNIISLGVETPFDYDECELVP